MKNKPKIKKLKYPLWFSIIFYLLTVLAPLVILVAQGFTSNHPLFKITFVGITILLVTWIFVRKFLLRNFEKKVIEKKVLYEHDYEIEVGSPDKCKYLWYENELILTLFNIVQLILLGATVLIIAIAIQQGYIKTKASIFAIFICYIIAYATKVIIILTQKNKNEISEVEENEKENREETTK